MKMFVCPKHKGELTITPTFCGQLWRAQLDVALTSKAKTSPCNGCSIGRAHFTVNALLIHSATKPDIKPITVNRRKMVQDTVVVYFDMPCGG